MSQPLLKALFLALLLLPACKEQDGRREPGAEDVFAVQDSIRNVLLLRIGRAQQEINRQVEAMRNRAYDADKATAQRLNQKIAIVEKAYEKLQRQTQRIEGDSLLGDWGLLEQETELIIIEVSRALETPF